jgi:hypothetical protein
MLTNCHHCNSWEECSLMWEVQLDGSRDLKLICAWCVFRYAYKFVVYVLGK